MEKLQSALALLKQIGVEKIKFKNVLSQGLKLFGNNVVGERLTFWNGLFFEHWQGFVLIFCFVIFKKLNRFYQIISTLH